MTLKITYYLNDLLGFSIFITTTTGLIIFLFSLSFLTKKSNPIIEKLSAYECGFQPFSNAHLPFTIHYYRIALLFLIFDIEIIFCFPLIFVINYVLTILIICTIFSFLRLLVLGFIYEFNTNNLDFVLE